MRKFIFAFKLSKLFNINKYLDFMFAISSIAVSTPRPKT